WMSESQERMMAVVEPARVEEFLAVCAKWDVRAAVIGEVTGTGRLVMTWHGETVVDIPPGSAADGPVYQRPFARPVAQDALAADDPAALPRAPPPSGRAGTRCPPMTRPRCPARPTARDCAPTCWPCSARPAWPTRA